MSASIHGLLLEVKVLAPLSSWEPVGSRLESLTTALQGEGAVTEPELVALRAWARRWTLLPEAIRAFYLLHLQDEMPTARVCLWKVLHAERPEDWQVRKLSYLWEQDTGCFPFRIDLAPMIK